MLGTLTMWVLAGLFFSMGIWQTNRAADKSEIEQQHSSASIVSFKQALAGGHRFARIDVSGHYDPRRHILLDNQIWHGRGGVHVFTPFHTLDGTTILVNRGWLPLAPDRQSLPAVPTPLHETVLRGILNTLPVPGRILGAADKMQADEWPQLVTYLNHHDIAQSLNLPLEKWVVQLSKSEQAGFEDRNWKPVYLSSSRHKGYAFQWFALALVSLVLWVFMGYRKPTEDQ
jgi:surfeit locus 1 family protein